MSFTFLTTASKCLASFALDVGDAKTPGDAQTFGDSMHGDDVLVLVLVLALLTLKLSNLACVRM